MTPLHDFLQLESDKAPPAAKSPENPRMTLMERVAHIWRLAEIWRRGGSGPDLEAAISDLAKDKATSDILCSQAQTKVKKLEAELKKALASLTNPGKSS